jgi:hypothetical protein
MLTYWQKLDRFVAELVICVCRKLHRGDLVFPLIESLDTHILNWTLNNAGSTPVLIWHRAEHSARINAILPRILPER